MVYNLVEVVKNKVVVGHQIIIKMNTHLIKQDSPYRFYYIVVLTALMQAVGCGSEVISSIWDVFSWNHDTDMWEIEWQEGGNGCVNLVTFSRDATNIEVNVFHSMACYLITQGWGTKVLMSINFCFHVLKIYARG